MPDKASFNRQDRHFLYFALAVIAALIAVAGINYYHAQSGPGAQVVTYSQFIDRLEAGDVRTVRLNGNDMEIVLQDGALLRSYAPDDPQLIADLRAADIAIVARPAPAPAPSMGSTLLSLLPMLLILGVLIFFFTRRPGAGSQASNLGKSKARLLDPLEGRVTFADVAGVDEARDSLAEIVDFLREPETFGRLGGRIPRGVLLVGPPGSGKTLLARAVAGEAGVPFYSISGSDFVEMFVGIGASRVRDLFAKAKASAPCIVFMDEIDAVGRHRGAGLGQGNDEREQTLNQILVEMDGFDATEGVILIAATNRPDVLDPALVRPGRFDREVVVDHPDVTGRQAILEVHARKTPLEPDVDLSAIARGTPGFSGADLMNLVNESALLAVRRGKSAVGALELEDAKDKVLMGDERRSHIMTEAEKRLAAYRESGRALVACKLPSADPVHRVTIIPRGRNMGGALTQLPEIEERTLTARRLTTQLAILMAGRAAEELVFGRAGITTGTADDIENATQLARTMVARYGMSEALGPIAYEEREDEVFLGHSLAKGKTLSEVDAGLVTAETRKLVEAALAEARTCLVENREALERLSHALIAAETLSSSEIAEIVDGDSRVATLPLRPSGRLGA